MTGVSGRRGSRVSRELRLTAIATTSLLAVLLVRMPIAYAAIPTCFGQVATVAGATSGPDNLDGSPGDDVIIGLGGDDTIHGNGGTDLICGSGGSDALYSDDGNARMAGGPGDDQLFGGTQRDFLYGGDGNDQSFGAAGNDLLNGQAGDDLLEGGRGDDALSGAQGSDIASYVTAESGVHVSLTAGTGVGAGSDSVIGFEGVIGSAFDDTLTGDSGPTNTLIGGPGDDQLNGGDGIPANCTASGSCFDYLAGSDGNDALRGGPGTDFASFFDSLFPISVDLSSGSASGDGNDILFGIEGIDGSNAADTMNGSPGDNFFVGEAGDDQISGGGHDQLGDAAFYLFATGSVDVSLAAGVSSGSDGSDTLSSIQNLIGSDFADALVGNAQGNVILALNGADFLNGRGGTDTLDGGDGTDQCVNGESNPNCEATASPAMPSHLIRESLGLQHVAARLQITEGELRR